MRSNTWFTARLMAAACVMTACVAAPATAQTVRSWTGAGGSAWLTTSNWDPTGTWPGSAPNANPTGEGAATDIFSIAPSNSASTIGINMGTLSAAGGVGLILGGIDVNKTNTTNVSIYDSSPTPGLLQLNGATINSVANTLIRVTGSANFTLAGVSTGTLGLRLGNTNGIFDVTSGRNLTLSGTVSEPAATPSGFTKTSTGTLTLNAANTFSGTVTLSAGVLSLNNSSALGTGTLSLGASAAQVAIAAANIDINRPVSIAGGGGGSTGQGLIQFAPASGSGTWSGNITINGNPTSGGMFGSGGGELVLSGTVRRTGSGITIRTGVVTLANAGNVFTEVNVTSGLMKLGVDNAVPVSGSIGLTNFSNLTFTSTMSLNGYNQTAKIIYGTGSSASILNDSATRKTLTLTGATYNSPYTVIGKSGTGSMTFSDGTGGMDLTFSTGTNMPVIDATTAVTISSTLTSANGFTKLGAGSLVLSASNGSLLGGTVTGSAGTIVARTSGALGTGTVALAGATLQFDTANGTYENAIVSSTATQINATNVAVTLSGPVMIAGDMTFRGSGGDSNRFTLSNNNAITSTNNSSVTFNVDSSQNHAVSGIISLGTGSLSKFSSATLTLSNAANSFSGGLNQRGSGGITISAAGAQGGGTISFGAGGSGAITFSSVNGTVVNDIVSTGGSGGITKSGTGSTLTLSGNNTYTGATTISGGYIRVASSTALAATGTIALTASAGTPGGLQFEPGITIDRRIQTAGRSNATTTGYVIRSLGGNTESRGPIEINNTGGNYGFVSDSGTLTLSGTLTSVATGPQAVRGVQFSGDGDFIVSGNVVKGGTLAVQDLQIAMLGNGLLTLSGTNDYGGGTSVSSGTLRAGRDSAFGTGTVTVSGGTLDLAGLAITNGISVSQGGVVNASAYAGAQTVTGAISYSGTVGGTMSVAAGGVLKGNGVTFTGPVTVTGTHSPGSSPGQQIFTNGLGYTSAATLVWELSANTAAALDRGILYDAIDLTTAGSLSIDPSATIRLVFNASRGDTTPSTVDWSDPFWADEHQWLLVDVVSPVTWNQVTFGNVLVGNDVTGAALATARPSSTFAVTTQGGDLYVVYVPEPALALVGIAALAGMLRCGSRRGR